MRNEIRNMTDANTDARLAGVLKRLDIAASNWYRKHVPEDERRRPGPEPKTIPQEVTDAVVKMATENPWYGYKRIAVMCRRDGKSVTDRQAYGVMKLHDLLQKRRPYKAEVYQASKLYELLPNGPNELWQMDVTYIHIPGFGWYYAVTVIDYYSRYLLACYLTSSYSAPEVLHALGLARTEAERLCGPLEKIPFLVTDNGPSFISRRFRQSIEDIYSHVRIRYNQRRPHWALVPEEGGDPLVPEEVYTGGRSIAIPRWQGWARGAKKKLEKMLAEQAA